MAGAWLLHPAAWFSRTLLWCVRGAGFQNELPADLTASWTKVMGHVGVLLPVRSSAKRWRRGLHSLDEETSNEHEVVGEPEILVSSDGIRSDKEGLVDSKHYGFRFWVPTLSQPSFGPITASSLGERTEIDGEKFQGLLQVECLPDGMVFDSPLWFDFLVDGGGKNDPIVDDFGRVRYEVLTKDKELEPWAREDPEYFRPLQVIRDKGKIYVRAQVRHFCFKGFFKRDEFKPQHITTEDIGWRSRKQGKTNIENGTDIPIRVYMFRMSEFNASLNSFKSKLGTGGIGVSAEIDGNLSLSRNAISSAPGFKTVYPGKSEFFNVPSYNCLKRKAVFVFATCFTVDRDGRRQSRVRIEAMMTIRGNKKVTITLPTREGRVLADPAAEVDDNNVQVLSGVLQVIRNCAMGTSGTNTLGVAPAFV